MGYLKASYLDFIQKKVYPQIMRKLLLIGSIILTTFVASPLTVFAQENMRVKERATLARSEVINTDYFSAGEKVVISGTVNGDVYIAGGNVTVDGQVNGDLISGGGIVDISGKVSGDVRAAGGTVSISGSVGGNVTVFGGTVKIEKSSFVTGSLVGGGGTLQILGPVGNGATIVGGDIMINNKVGGDVWAGVGSMDVGSDAEIAGKMTYVSSDNASIAPEAKIAGEVVRQDPPKEFTKKREVKGFGWGWGLYTLLTSLVIGSLLVWLAPNLITRTAEYVTSRPWASLGIGFLALVATPILAILLFITLLGIPLGILLMVGYVITLFFAHLFTGIAIGGLIAGYMNWKKNLYASLIVGLIALTLVGVVPFLGTLASFIATLLGLGALIQMKFTLFRDLRTSKTL